MGHRPPGSHYRGAVGNGTIPDFGFGGGGGFGDGGGFMSGPDPFGALPPRAQAPANAGAPIDRAHLLAAVDHAALDRIEIRYKSLHVCAAKMRCAAKAVQLTGETLGAKGPRSSYYPDQDRARVPALAPNHFRGLSARDQREAHGQGIHELVHALEDQDRMTGLLWEFEAVAFVVQMTYLHHRRIAEEPGCPIEHNLVDPHRVRLYRVGHEVASATGCLTANGRPVTLQESQLLPLRDALQSVPNYGSRAMLRATGFNGLAGGCACSVGV